MRRLAIAALGSLALAGCGGGGGDEEASRPLPVEPPAGWTAVQGAGFAFARPAAFAPLPGRPRPEGEQLLGFERPAPPSGLPSQVGVGVEEDVADPLSAAVRLALEESRIAYPGHRVLRRSTPRVPGGGRAVRVDAEYEAFTEDRRRVRTVDLWVQTKGGRRLNLFARGPAADFDALGLDELPRTLRLR